MVVNGLCYYFGGFVELFVEDFVVVIVGDEADFKKKRWHIGVGIYIVIAERVVTKAFFYSAILLACQVADITDKIFGERIRHLWDFLKPTLRFR